MHTNWNINVSFVIHVNFDHAWAEHYPVTLKYHIMLYNVTFYHTCPCSFVIGFVELSIPCLVSIYAVCALYFVSCALILLKWHSRQHNHWTTLNLSVCIFIWKVHLVTLLPHAMSLISCASSGTLRTGYCPNIETYT